MRERFVNLAEIRSDMQEMQVKQYVPGATLADC